MEFSERLRHARESAKLTQEQLAQKSGVKQGTISKIERGDADSSTFTVQLAIACGVRPEWLAIEDGPMIDQYKIAEEIANKLESKERAAWYRFGRALAEPTEGTNGDQ